jgi:hypothetical protein
MRHFLVLSDEDNVAVAIRDVERGVETKVDGVGLVVQEPIPLGHKIALRAIRTGERILKFGVPVGVATDDIHAGAHVHLHNVRSDYINNALEYYE